MIHNIPRPLRTILIAAAIGFVAPLAYMFVGRLMYTTLMALDLGEPFSVITTVMSMGAMLFLGVAAFLSETTK